MHDTQCDFLYSQVDDGYIIVPITDVYMDRNQFSFFFF